MRTHVLDASALFRYLMNADGAEVVDQLFRQAAVSRLPILMSVVNWGEVYYGLVKRAGLTRTDGTMTNLLGRVPLSLVAVTADDAVRAAKLKAQYNLPYADAFAAALTGHQNVLVTADVDHFSRVPKLRLLKLPRAKNSLALPLPGPQNAPRVRRGASSVSETHQEDYVNLPVAASWAYHLPDCLTVRFRVRKSTKMNPKRCE